MMMMMDFTFKFMRLYLYATILLAHAFQRSDKSPPWRIYTQGFSSKNLPALARLSVSRSLSHPRTLDICESRFRGRLIPASSQNCSTINSSKNLCNTFTLIYIYTLVIETSLIQGIELASNMKDQITDKKIYPANQLVLNFCTLADESSILGKKPKIICSNLTVNQKEPLDRYLFIIVQ